jgi:phosphate-selective porin OprO and OprP
VIHRTPRIALVWLTAILLFERPMPAHADSETPSAPAAIDSAAASEQPSAREPSPEMQAVISQLRAQDEELRKLRERLGQLQSEVRTLPPVSTGVVPAGFSNDLAPAAASESNSEIFQLQDRISSLEQRLDKQSSQPKGDGDDPKGYEVGSDLKMTASWRNGVQFQSANKDFRLHIGGTIQFDIALFDNDDALTVAPAAGGIGPQPDSLDMRRVRLRMDGTMYEVFDWVVQYDLANFVSVPTPSVQAPASTNPSFNEIYINWGQLPYVGNFRVGSFKEPIGFEHLESDAFLPFMERSYLQDFVFGPFHGGYSPGMAFLDWTENLEHTWGIGFFGSDSDNFAYSLGNDYALTGRWTWCPYYDEPSDGRYALHFGIAGSTKAADENIDRLRVRGDIRSGPPGVLNPVYADTGNIKSTNQEIAACEVAAVMGSFSMVGEYVGTWINNAFLPNNVSRGTPFFQGGYVQVGYYLTGEHDVYDRKRGTFDRVTPFENAYCVRSCDGECKGWGAWQILARYNAIDLNDNGINGGTLDSFTLGVNWLWNANSRVQLNYDFTARGPVKTVAAGDINALGIRFSYDF